MRSIHTTALLLLLALVNPTSGHCTTSLQQMYEAHCREPSDINEHVSVLHDYARECSSVCEIGVRYMVATWGLLQGLTESSAKDKSYLGIDLSFPPSDKLELAKTLSKANGIAFTFLAKNDMELTLEPVDLLFIDTLHTYCHLTYELETFSGSVQKYICLHDTSPPWGYADEWYYKGDCSEYPFAMDTTKKGLWPAVTDFLEKHPEWELHERLLNNNGLTVLKRVDE